MTSTPYVNWVFRARTYYNRLDSHDQALIAKIVSRAAGPSVITIMASHDNSYNLLFSHLEMVRDLLLGFVKEEWFQGQRRSRQVCGRPSKSGLTGFFFTPAWHKEALTLLKCAKRILTAATMDEVFKT
jgi:hypothetical protein